ncbi:MAG TPA: GNAT family N-acetyltransferase [Streptosporangiaceae bacterium]
MSEPVDIRPYQPADLDALYRICLLTAASGEDATAMFHDPDLPGHVFAAPYGVLEPSLAFVAADAAGVAGYVIGALDTPAFADRLERQWWPRLRGRYAAPDPDIPFEQLDFEQQVISGIHHPFGHSEEIVRQYPSHLHIDLLPRLQGHGLGGAMMATLLDALRAQGSAGVHLYCAPDNARATGFYRHLGFTPVDPDSPLIYVMDLRDGE